MYMPSPTAFGNERRVKQSEKVIRVPDNEKQSYPAFFKAG